MLSLIRIIFGNLPLMVIIFSCSTTKLSLDKYTGPQWGPEFKGEPLKRVSIAMTGLITSDSRVDSDLFKNVAKLKEKLGTDSVLIEWGEMLEKEENFPYDLFEISGYDGIGVSSLVASSKKVTSINSSIIDVKTGRLIGHKGLSSSLIIEKGGVKIGIIAARAHNREEENHHYYMDPVLAVIKLRKYLAKQGVNIVVLMTEVDSNCRQYRSTHPSPEIKCDEDDPLMNLIGRLPPGFVNLVVNRSNGYYYGKISDTFVMQLPKNKRVVSWAEFYIDMKDNTLDNRRTKVNSSVLLSKIL